MNAARLSKLLLTTSLLLMVNRLPGQSTRDAPLRSVVSEPNGKHSTYGRAIAAPGVPELVEITPTLYRGGQPTDAGLRTLAAMGFSIVIDERELHWTERRKVTRLGMRYVALRWFCLFPSDKVFAKFLAIIRQNPHKKIFVHCRLGDDRVGAMIATYRMVFEHWTAEQAMREMKVNGFNSFHRCCICPRLAGYERSFPARYKTDPVFHATMDTPEQFRNP